MSDDSGLSAKKIIISAIVSIFLVLLGAGVSWFVQTRQSTAANKLRYVDYQDRFLDSVIRQPTIPGKKIEILLDGQRVANVSQVSVAIYNFSDRDYEQVPIYITLKGEDGNALQLIGESAAGANNIPEAITPIANVAQGDDPSVKRYGYMVTTLNRTQFTEPQFSANYLILGKNKPRVDVQTQKIGLELRQYSPANYGSSWLGWLPFIFVLLYVAGIYLAHRFALKRALKQDEKIRLALVATLSKPEAKDQLSLGQEPSVLAGYLLKEMQKVRWEQLPRLGRWLSGLSKPE